MAIENARKYLKQFGVAGRIQEFAVSSATVQLAAQALDVQPARIAKSLSFLVGDQPVIVVVAGDARIDNIAYKTQFHVKAKMLTAEQVEEQIGHAVGGVCPFGIKQGVSVYLDVSLQRFQTVFPAVGSANSAIELSCDELYAYSNAKSWVDVCKDWRDTVIV